MITNLLLPVVLCSPGANFALIATNNRSLELTRPDLRYADDDGVKYAELFEEINGPENVILLTELDFESRRLYPGWVDRALPPTLANLDRAVASIAARLRRGERAEVHVVLAGHGDLDRGQGYLELQDGRLTAAELEERIVRRLEVDRLHLILDSCNSYFMLNPRKPGARRFESSGRAPLLDRYPHVGALVSTSAEAVTYEWSELQSGIFSYEVRSGLRGAADADADGRISYLELAAFLHTANRSIPNELYRPKIFARGPSGREEEILLAANTGVLARSLRLAKGTERRLTIRDSLGVRVLDVNKHAEAEMILRLPARSGDLGVYELVPGGERPVVVFRSIDTSTLSAANGLESFPASPPALGARGEAPVFEKLFAEPFGPQAIAEYRAQRSEEVYGISSAHTQRLGTFLDATSSSIELERRLTGAGAIGVGGAFAALGALSAGEDAVSSGVLIGAGVALSAGGVLMIALPMPIDELRRRLDSGGERAVLVIEGELEELAKDQRTIREIAGWSGVAAGSALGVMSAMSIAAETETRGAQIAVLPLSLLVLATGAQMLLTPSPAEELWENYASGEASRGITIAPLVSQDRGGELRIGLGLGGAF